MIVKIQNNFNGYIILDDVRDVDYNIKHCDKKTMARENNFPLENDNHKYREIFSGEKGKYIDISIYQRFRCYRIRTDNAVYLMNDEGKTIERLN